MRDTATKFKVPFLLLAWAEIAASISNGVEVDKTDWPHIVLVLAFSSFGNGSVDFRLADFQSGVMISRNYVLTSGGVDKGSNLVSRSEWTDVFVAFGARVALPYIRYEIQWETRIPPMSSYCQVGEVWKCFTTLLKDAGSQIDLNVQIIKAEMEFHPSGKMDPFFANLVMLQLMTPPMVSGAANFAFLSFDEYEGRLRSCQIAGWDEDAYDRTSDIDLEFSLRKIDQPIYFRSCSHPQFPLAKKRYFCLSSPKIRERTNPKDIGGPLTCSLGPSRHQSVTFGILTGTKAPNVNIYTRLTPYKSWILSKISQKTAPKSKSKRGLRTRRVPSEAPGEAPGEALPRTKHAKKKKKRRKISMVHYKETASNFDAANLGIFSNDAKVWGLFWGVFSVVGCNFVK